MDGVHHDLSALPNKNESRGAPAPQTRKMALPSVWQNPYETRVIPSA